MRYTTKPLCCSRLHAHAGTAAAVIAAIAFAPPALAQFADDCASAPSVAEGVFTFDLANASGGADPFTVPCAQDRLALIDGWVLYTPTVSGPVSISTVGLSTGDTVLSVHDYFSEFDCAFAPFQVRACNDDFEGPQSRVVVLATAGQPMLVRIAGAMESRPSGSVRIETFAPVAGDTCDTAIAATQGTNIYSVGDAVINDFVSCFGLRDVWFSYTPEESGALTVSTCGQPTAANISIFNGCGDTVLACTPFGGCAAAVGVDAGVPLLIRIANDDAVAPEQFTITLDPGGLPTNDNCSAPLPIGLGETAFDNTFATTEFPVSCGSGPFPFASGLDLWYVFTPQESGVYDITTGQSIGIGDTTLAVYSACSDLPIACDEDGSGFLSFIRTELTAGQPYLIQVSGAGLPDAGSPIDRGQGILTLRQSIPPGNDDCNDAIDIGEGLIPFDLFDATTGPQPASCVPGGLTTGRDVWFRHTPAQDGPLELNISAQTGATFAVFASCSDNTPRSAGTYFDAQTGADAARAVFDAQSGVPLLIRVSTAVSPDLPDLPGAAGELYIGPPTAPIVVNDRCAAALPISAGATQIDLAGATKECNASDDPSFDSCASVIDNNVFYRFTAAATEPVTIQINDGVDYPFFDGLVVSVHSTCGGPPVACSFPFGDAPADALSFDAIDGQEYIIRVGSVVRFGSLGILAGELVIDATAPCPGDWDGSGGIDGDDIVAFFADWQIGEADIDQSGGTDGDDITYFFERWQAGC